MKSGARFTEQLLGFPVVGPGLTSHLPQPLFSSSFCFSRASACWRDSEGAAHTSDWKDAANSSAKNLGQGICRTQPGLLERMKSFGSVLLRWHYSAAASPCDSVQLQLCMNASVSQKHRSPLQYAGFSMSKPVNVFLAKARA